MRIGIIGTGSVGRALGGAWQRRAHEVVYGVRQQRAGETLMKKLTSFLFYRLMGRIADVPIPADTGDFRLMDRRVLDVFRQFQEEPRFFRGLIALSAMRWRQIVVGAQKTTKSTGGPPTWRPRQSILKSSVAFPLV